MEGKSIFEDLRKNGLQDKSDLANVVDTLLDNRWKRRKTRLNNYTVCPISVLDTIAQIWDIKFLKLFINDYTEYLTSKDGKGRQEIVDITKYTIDRQEKAHKEMMEVLGKR